MEYNRTGRIALTNNLVMLERGDEELLLVNSFALQPLYIKSGRAHIKRVLDAVSASGSWERLETAFPEDAQLFDLLRDHRIIVEAGSEKPADVQADLPRLKAARNDRPSISLYLLLTQSCNLACIYCLNGMETYKAVKKQKMSEEVAFRAVETCLEKLNPDGKLEIAFFGGEPLLNWPLAKKVIRHCEDVLKPKYPDREIQYHITSNLTVLPDDLVEWAKKYRISFLCDIDGHEPIHNQCRPYKGGKPSHADIAAHVRLLIEHGLNVAMRATVTSLNQDHMLETARYHKEIGGYGSAFVPVSPVNSDEDILGDDLLPDPKALIDGLVDIYRSGLWDSSLLFPFSTYASKIQPGMNTIMGCGAPYGNTPVVDVEGGVYPCIYLVGIKRFYLGNILDPAYPDEGVLDRMMEFLHVDNLEDCRDCSWRYICGGGCPVGRLTILDNPAVTSKVRDYCVKISCEYTKKVLELLFWELAGEASLAVDKAEPQKPSVAIDRSYSIRC